MCKVNTKVVLCAEAVNEMNTVEKTSHEVQQILRELPFLFNPKELVRNYKIKIDMKENERITQQKSR